MPGPSLPIISGPLPSGIQVFAYDVSADTCFVVTDDGDSIMTFQAKSTTFTKSVHCGVVEYEFQNGYASGLKLIGFPRVFASNIKDPMKADAGFGWRSGMTENNICKQGVSLIEDRLRGRTGSFETRLCSEMQELFAGVLDG
ncbi:hypothetical protein FOZ61_003914 [Perkinsus olseni]|uniref:Uncharacterized protein n=1 Tax=Perkinsus olseni TaxID=32597 RepID=A0A7J6KM22_PEROL|nr:hypothetical protein FOZ61_003914 [Perkinsus olseni]